MLLATRSVSNLEAALKGRVIRPDDAEYDTACTIFYGGMDRRPALIVRVADATDVARVLTFARETGAGCQLPTDD